MQKEMQKETFACLAFFYLKILLYQSLIPKSARARYSQYNKKNKIKRKFQNLFSILLK